MSRILIADREAATVKSLTRLLRGEKFEVESAATGKELQEKLATTKPDLILSALHLPSVFLVVTPARVCRWRQVRAKFPPLNL